jgi:trimeric autotransporter adhesin
MKHLNCIELVLALASLIVATGRTGAAPVGTAFTYQGRLIDGTNVANGQYDLQFVLFDAASGGNPVGPTNLFAPVAVSNGQFTLALDFGDLPFDGSARWLEVGVRTNGAVGGFTTLTPRQAVTPTPYAIHALTLEPRPGMTGYYSTVGGGSDNSSGGEGATVGGGVANSSPGGWATIGGGMLNSSGGQFATVAGGYSNESGWGADWATIGGGYHNRVPAYAVYGTVAGGAYNVSSGQYATVGGGCTNASIGLGATVGGGYQNTSSNDFVTIGGGVGNTSGGYAATVGGGYYNQSRSWAATVAGGDWNEVESGSDRATIGGGEENVILGGAHNATICGGQENYVREGGFYATVGGGEQNQNGAAWATIAGGGGNSIGTDSSYSTIGGGEGHSIAREAWNSTIGGGEYNLIGTQTDGATIGGGAQNAIRDSADAATIGGGNGNVVGSNAKYAAIPGGSSNEAAGGWSFAAGRRAKARAPGAFVWGDSTDADVASTNANSWTVRASGGVTFFTATNLSSGAVLSAGSGSRSSLSDREAKDDVQSLDGRAVLEQLARVPLSSWRYKAQGPGVRHVGPMAQDFHAAFGVGEDERHISSVDADGVALAAIQGLNEKVETGKRKVEELEKENVELKARLAALEQLLKAQIQK